MIKGYEGILRPKLHTVRIREENRCYECGYYKNIENDPVRSGICKKYYSRKDTWDEAIEQCKRDKAMEAKIR
jgi:hypothetical protein